MSTEVCDSGDESAPAHYRHTIHYCVYCTQPTGPGCQRKTPWCVHTNDPVNLGSGPEFWLQFANAVEFGENTVVIYIVHIHRCFG